MKPISMNVKMAQRCADGSKTMTRLPVKVQPPKQFQIPFLQEGRLHFCETSAGNFPMWKSHQNSPYGQPVDRLWVREPARVVDRQIGTKTNLDYMFSDGARGRCVLPKRFGQGVSVPKWVQKCQGVPNGCIHEMARTFLEITSVRVERVQDISEADALAEGLTEKLCLVCGGKHKYFDPLKSSVTYRGNFRGLWDSIYSSKGFGWDVNPWVWVYEFKKVSDKAQTGGEGV